MKGNDLICVIAMENVDVMPLQTSEPRAVAPDTGEVLIKSEDPSEVLLF